MQTGTEDYLINTQYDLHYEILLRSVHGGGGGGGGWRERNLGGIPMGWRDFVEVDRGGVLTYGKDDQCACCPSSNLPAHLNKLISLSFSPFSIQ